MIDAFVEGVRSLGQACQLVILAPAAMLVIATRGRWEAVTGAVAGVVLGGWAFAARWIVPSDVQLRFSALVVGLLVVGAAFGRADVAGSSRTAHLRRWLGRASTMAVSAVVTGVLVTQWWRPCVGEELGEILTLTPDDPLGQLPAVVGFMTAVALPLVVIGLLFAAWRPEPRVGAAVGYAGAGVGLVLAASVVVGQHGEIVAKLFEWSQ